MSKTGLIEQRAAISALQRYTELRADAPASLPSVAGIVAVLAPEEPLHCIRPAAITASSAAFVRAFNGTVLYAVKCNPEPSVLRAVWAGGVRCFDCASISEVALVRGLLPGASIHFMHPVKSRAAIREAWIAHGVRNFVLDTMDELAKIYEERAACSARAHGTPPGLFIRLALPQSIAAIDLSSKFGADSEDAVSLLRAARPWAGRLGVAFHVGSQCMEPLA